MLAARRKMFVGEKYVLMGILYVKTVFGQVLGYSQAEGKYARYVESP